MPWGGKRVGAGSYTSGAFNVRKWLRSLVEDPKRRILFEKAIDKELRDGNTNGFFKALTHGIGVPPQALDVHHSGNVTLGVRRAAFADGRPLLATDVSAPGTGVGEYGAH